MRLPLIVVFVSIRLFLYVPPSFYSTRLDGQKRIITTTFWWIDFLVGSSFCPANSVKFKRDKENEMKCFWKNVYWYTHTHTELYNGWGLESIAIDNRFSYFNQVSKLEHISESTRENNIEMLTTQEKKERKKMEHFLIFKNLCNRFGPHPHTHTSHNHKLISLVYLRDWTQSI